MVNIHDRSSAGPGEYFDIYDFVVDDVNVMQYFIDTYGVTGNIVQMCIRDSPWSTWPGLSASS